MLEIPPQELNALRQLGKGGIEYLLVGGYARLYAAIAIIIGHPPHFEVGELSKPKKRISFEYDGLNLDILTTLPGLEFSDAFAAREVATQSGARLFVISKGHLVLSKRHVAATDQDAARRQREQDDVSLLESN
jgi:hypothetical protein